MPKMVENDPLDSVQVAFRVHILHVRRLDIKLIIWAEVLIILVDGNFCHAGELKRAGTLRKDIPGPSCTPAARPVSYAQHRLTLRIVYPPPPSMSNGLLKDLTNFTQFA